MNWLCPLLVLTALSTSSAKRSFIFTGPKVYDVGEKETLALNLIDISESGNVNIRLVNTSGNEVYSELRVPIENGKSTTVEFPIPSQLPKNVRRARVELDGLIGDYRIKKSLEVGLRTKRPIIFVNTDKPIYKAGQTVRIRVLVTDSNLRPHKEAKVEQIWITDPNRIRIAQWSNESLGAGLIHETVRLPEEPTLGRWWINVKIDDRPVTRSFEVREYVLPRFEVKVTPSSYSLFTDESSTWDVCAKYTYGKPVKGQLLTRLSQSVHYRTKEREYIVSTADIKGCTKVTVPMKELIHQPGYYPYYSLELFAEVTEEGTGTRINSTATSTPHAFPYFISRIDHYPNYFKPGIPLKMAVAVRTPDSKPLADELISVCMVIIRKKWNNLHTITDNANVCKNYTSDKDGNIHFTIPPQDPNAVSLRIELETAVWEPKSIGAYQLQKPRHSFTMTGWFSPGGNHIQLPRIQKIDCDAFGPDVKATLPFHISHSETEIKKVYYQIMSRGDIVRHGEFDLNLRIDSSKDMADDTYIPDESAVVCTKTGFEWDDEVEPVKHVSQHHFVFQLDDKMIPRVRVLLYTVTEDGEVVADSASYETDPCFSNQVKMRFGDEKQFPGEKATIHLTAEPESLCSVGIVDKSVYILQKADLLSGSGVNKNLLHLDTTASSYPEQRSLDHMYCSNRNQGQIRYEPVGYLDTISAFEENGGIVLSDLPLETRPCMRQGSSDCFYPYYTKQSPYPSTVEADNLDYLQRGESAGSSPSPPGQPPVITFRTEFPDTWLFELYTIPDQGSLELKQKMPDSITEWQGQAVCLHPDKGLGLSQQASIIAFQPFFASLTLPYSIVRNETVPVIVTAFNYLEDCLPIKVHLAQTERFALYNGTLARSACVCGGESSTTYFYITPRKLGVMNVTVTAETTEDKEVCGSFDVALDVKRSDTLTNPVLVEAEGFTKEEVLNSYFCIGEEEGGVFEAEHLLVLPETKNLVWDSARAYASVTGDLMGPTLEGLDRLVTMPTGCGEQNMIRLVPNIVVLDYLKAIKKLTEELRLKAVEHIRQGYVQQQKYHHFNGSYSAFGNIDKEGSMWLTAFVVRTFGSARRYINIDESSFNKSREWILSRQRGNGCFPMVGTVHNKAMKGGISKEDETTSTLTAYILISMLESGKMDEEPVARGLRCIEAKSKPSNYSLSLFAYAAALAKHPSSSLEQLISAADRDGELLYWNDEDRSIAVETASYAILALLESGSKEDFAKAASIARWLAKQRNSYGGFYSTQDTVMALQALAKYGSIISSKPPQMEVSVKTDKVDEKFHVNPENQLLMQRTKLKLEEEPETKVEIAASGSGCALVQTNLRYNIFVPSDTKDFTMTVAARKRCESCSEAEIQICASYEHPDGSNMAIFEIKMVTGYTPVIDSVQALVQRRDLEIKRYDFQENTNTLFLYVQTLTQNVACFSFDVTLVVKVLDAKPSSVKVYDYYDEGKSLSVPYTIKET